MGECFEQETIFPLIQLVIHEIHAGKQPESSADADGFASHEEIVQALLTHEQGRLEVQAAVSRCPQHSTSWMADNMIQWWSQKYTTSGNEWARQFQRKRIAGAWAYKPRKSVSQITAADEHHTRSVQLSRQIWPRLIDLAAAHRTITYKELGARLGIRGQALQNFDRILAPIKYYCLLNGLPPLSALVVYTGTGLPGSGAEADADDIARVFAYDWKGRRPLVPSEDELANAVSSI